MLKKFKNHARIVGRIQTIKKNSAYKKEGNKEMYTPENIAKRQALAQHPAIVKAIDAFWNVVNLIKDSNGCISRCNYIQMHTKMQRAMVEDFDEGQALREAQEDWQKDVAGKSKVGMDRQLFQNSIFQLADIWAEEIDLHQYTSFLNVLLIDVSRQFGDSGKARQWKGDAEIKAAAKVRQEHDAYDSEDFEDVENASEAECVDAVCDDAVYDDAVCDDIVHPFSRKHAVDETVLEEESASFKRTIKNDESPIEEIICPRETPSDIVSPSQSVHELCSEKYANADDPIPPILIPRSFGSGWQRAVQRITSPRKRKVKHSGDGKSPSDCASSGHTGPSEKKTDSRAPADTGICVDEVDGDSDGKAMRQSRSGTKSFRQKLLSKRWRRSSAKTESNDDAAASSSDETHKERQGLQGRHKEELKEGGQRGVVPFRLETDSDSESDYSAAISAATNDIDSTGNSSDARRSDEAMLSSAIREGGQSEGARADLNCDLDDDPRAKRKRKRAGRSNKVGVLVTPLVKPLRGAEAVASPFGKTGNIRSRIKDASFKISKALSPRRRKPRQPRDEEEEDGGTKEIGVTEFSPGGLAEHRRPTDQEIQENLERRIEQGNQRFVQKEAAVKLQQKWSTQLKGRIFSFKASPEKKGGRRLHTARLPHTQARANGQLRPSKARPVQSVLPKIQAKGQRSVLRGTDRPRLPILDLSSAPPTDPFEGIQLRHRNPQPQSQNSLW